MAERESDVVAAALRDEHGVAAELAAQLGAYGGLVLAANRRVNLTAAREPDAFAAHIADALTLAADITGPLIDLGSGAGLPGLPLAIATGVPVTLVDSVKKKAAFLREALAALGLAGDVRDERAEVLGHDPALRGRFAHATARAVAGASTVAEFTLPFLAIGGTALLQRGTMEDGDRRALADAALVLGGELVEERLIGGERRILVVVKRSPTQQRFPRRHGIPEKRPLCVASR
jgi:16S rRNA (guanine527-N7)-methyltransferase